MIPDSRTAELGGVAATEVPDTVGLLTRGYTHPMLAGRTVVRLVREPLTEVEDLSLDVLGFSSVSSAPVGYTRPKTIGFPEGPILSDPANARHALNLVGDLQRAAKIARSRPGPAKEMLDELASRLGASAPHFLPTFLEEASRIFLGLDNRTYATQYFTKAREAERVHNIPIDETRHRQVLLEFALAGALSAKELTTESKALLERHGPEEALEQFIGLNIDRVKGGQPPYANLHTDVKRLVKAAKADQQEVDERLLAVLLTAPSISKAPQAFWNAYQKPLAAMAKNTPEMQDLLFSLTPDGARTAGWLQVLEAAGVADEMRAGERDVLDWMQRFITKEGRSWNSDFPAELSLFIRRLPRQEGTVLNLPLYPNQAEPELLDAVLSLGGRVEFGGENHWRNRFDLGDWLGDERRGDLTHLAASEHAQLAAAGLQDVKLDKHLAVLLAHEGSRQLLHRWATTTLTADSTAPQFFTEFDRLKGLYIPAARAELAEELKHFEELADPAELTAKAIRDGLLTEFTWPALEAAAAEIGFDEAEPDEVTVQESWPWFGVTCRNRIIWVKGDERGPDITIDVPHGKRFDRWNWFRVGEDTACLSMDDSWDWHLTWASDPTTHHSQPDRGTHRRFQAVSVEFDGGRLVGSAPLRPGTPVFPTFSPIESVLWDGCSFWSHAGEDLKEMDPDSGKLGRKSLPQRMADLIEPDLREGFTLATRQTQWLSATPDTLDSPLGTADGQHGWVLLKRGTELRGHGIDGFTWQGDPGTPYDWSWPTGQLARPGGGHWLIQNGVLHLETLAVLSTASNTGGRKHLLHELPLAGWHHLRIRDVDVSARMRTMQGKDAAELVTALPEWSHDEPAELTAAVIQAVEQLLGTTDAALTHAVGWLALRINRAVQQLRQLRDDAEGDSSHTFGQWTPASDAVSWLEALNPQGGGVLSREDCARMVRALTSRRLERVIVGFMPRTLLLHPDLFLAGACRPFTTPEVRGGTAAAFGAVLDSGLHRPEAVILSTRQPWGASGTNLQYGQTVETPTGPAIILDSQWATASRCTSCCPRVAGALPR